jgi:hypothetical protein
MVKFTEPGKCYFVVDCLACEKPIPLAEVPSADQKPDHCDIGQFPVCGAHTAAT